MHVEPQGLAATQQLADIRLTYLDNLNAVRKIWPQRAMAVFDAEASTLVAQASLTRSPPRS